MSKDDARTRLILLDDHEMVREGMRMLLAAHSDLQVAASYSSVDEMALAMPPEPPDVVIAAASRTRVAEHDVQRIRDIFPGCAVLVLSDSEEDAPILDIIRAGAKGYLVKKAPVGHLLNAIRTVARGGTYVSPELSKWFLERIQFGGAGPRQNLINRLSPREIEVMKLVAAGKSSKEVAQTLNLEVETVRSYRKNLMRKLGVNKVASLTRLAITLGDDSEETSSGRSAAASAH